MITKLDTPAGAAVIIGAHGGIGAALFALLEQQNRYTHLFACARHHYLRLDLLDEPSIAAAARHIEQQTADVRLIIDATGVLENDRCAVEKSVSQIDGTSMAQAFAINAIGPALLMKHFIALMPRDQRCVFATLSARVGSIGENKLGGWYSYRASKAALNQIVKTAAIELSRSRPNAICVALHPGTVDTKLSQRFAKSGLEVQSPALAAARILTCLDQLSSRDSGGFFDQMGRQVLW